MFAARKTRGVKLPAVFLTACLFLTPTCVSSPPIRPAAPAPPAPSAPSGFVTARNGRLELDGRRYRFVGVNVYSLASFPPGSGKYFCGVAHSDRQVEEIVAEVADMGGRVIRLDAYQSFTDGGRDYSRLDFVIAAAARRGIKLVLTLENQWRDCTEGGYKYADWYRGGYRRPYGRYPLSYVDHVRRTVSRYRGEPAILMWQLMNEAESQNRWGVDDPEALAAFAQHMAEVVKAHDPSHLLSLGTSGLGRPGTGGLRFAILAATPGIDIVEAHDYDADALALPPSIRWSQGAARNAGKPFFIGEVGISSPPLRPWQRAALIQDKLEAAWDAGIDGVLIWSYRAGDGTNRDFDAADPLARTLRLFTARHRQDQ